MAKRQSNDPVKAALAAESRGGRQAAGTGYAYSKVDDVSAKDFAYEIVKRRGNAKSDVDPSAGTKKNRGPVMQDRLGPRFAIQAKMPGPVAPEARETQRNTKFVPSAINRSLPNFNYGRLG